MSAYVCPECRVVVDHDGYGPDLERDCPVCGFNQIQDDGEWYSHDH